MVRVLIFRTVEDAGPYDFVLPQLFVYLSICCLYRMQMGGRSKPLPYNIVCLYLYGCASNFVLVRVLINGRSKPLPYDDTF